MDHRTTSIIIGFIIFIVFFLIELFFAFIENEKYRKIFKIFPLLTLTIISFIVIPNYWYIGLGLFLGCLGDFLLIWEHKKPLFFIGGFSFFIGHFILFLSFFFITKIEPAWYYYFILICAFIIFLFITLFVVKNKLKASTKLIGCFYFFIIAASLSATIISSILVDKIFIISSVGYLFFFVSDALLVKKIFYGEYKRDDFYIMGTYLVAQFLILTGIVLFLLY